MVSVARDGSAADTLATVMPCILSYLFVGRKVREWAESAGTLEGNPFRMWIEEYSSDSYAASCDSISAFMAEVSRELTEAEREKAAEIFCTSSRFEAAFWAMAYREQISDTSL